MLADEAVSEITKLGRRAVALPLSLDEPAQVPDVVEKVAAIFGRLDVFVASAAATAFRPLLEQKPHNVTKTFAISVESFVAAVQAAAPLMKDGGRSDGSAPPTTSRRSSPIWPATRPASSPGR